MSAKIIDGKAIAAQFNEETRELVRSLSARGITPGLAVVLIGNDPASQVYVRNKIRTCEALGIRSELHALPETAVNAEVLALIGTLNKRADVHGILVQSPPPPQIDEAAIIAAIDPDKDVDCFAAKNVGKLLIGSLDGFKPCTPWGIIELLRRSGIAVKGAHAVIVGRSNIVGKPLAALLMQKAPWANATVTLVHSATPDIRSFTRSADILIAAVGKPELIRGDFIKPGAAVIDVGINRIADPETGKSKLVGDVCFAEASEVASAITPVPGGVGPMTIAVLMRNAVEAAARLS